MNIVVDGYNICYKTTGTGDKTVVILQGWGTDLGVYDSVAGVIDGSRYRVIQFDFPGFGGSDEPKEPSKSASISRMASQPYVQTFTEV